MTDAVRAPPGGTWPEPPDAFALARNLPGHRLHRGMFRGLVCVQSLRIPVSEPGRCASRLGTVKDSAQPAVAPRWRCRGASCKGATMMRGSSRSVERACRSGVALVQRRCAET